MFTKRMLILALVFAYTGIEQAFWTGIYPTCISFTQKLGTNTNALLALNSVAAGLGQVAAGLTFGILGTRTRRIGRDAIVFMGAVLHLLTFAMIYMNIPDNAPLQKTTDCGGILSPSVAIALVCGGLLGFGDACWNTQIYSFLCDRYSDRSSEAFAIFKFYQSLLSCAVFFYSSLLKLSWHLLILLVTSLTAAVCFFLIERFASPVRVEETPDAEAPLNLKRIDYRPKISSSVPDVTVTTDEARKHKDSK
ncbi:hypothetical protein OESDEN_00651 [Oesophagostomum dentatum]|uniref:UNC93-like protein MFSD11 n=1 Tax=Oesophagostomum dentatum TaxID=61180 RepID=A0A0B1TU34_OESDE|nr:hypothetical protein OESDEN_00651 [Oesophagostomum dentatum]